MSGVFGLIAIFGVACVGLAKMESHPSEIKKRNFWCKDEEFLEYSRKSYSSYMAGIPSHGDGTLIPKHLHFIWIGKT